MQTIHAGHDAYGYFASGFGNVNGLNKIQLQWVEVPVITGIGESNSIVNDPIPDPHYCSQRHSPTILLLQNLSLLELEAAPCRYCTGVST